MTVSINARCEDCGEVELTVPDVTLMVCSHAPLSYYEFTCPSCQSHVRKLADDHVIGLLVKGGVKPVVWDVPAEVLEPKSGPILTRDDLLDFHLELDRTDMLASFASRTAA